MVDEGACSFLMEIQVDFRRITLVFRTTIHTLLSLIKLNCYPFNIAL